MQIVETILRGEEFKFMNWIYIVERESIFLHSIVQLAFDIVRRIFTITKSVLPPYLEVLIDTNIDSKIQPNARSCLRLEFTPSR